MTENTALSTAEQNALIISYDVLGSHVELTLDFVKKYLVRGRADLTSDQEVVFFMNTCKMQKLNPLVQGECYLIKYSEKEPAQMVVGKDAYLRRAYDNPNYLQKQDGIIVQRGNEIIKKEGCCLYPGESLIGGWCRVSFVKRDAERTAYKDGYILRPAKRTGEVLQAHEAFVRPPEVSERDGEEQSHRECPYERRRPHGST